MMNYVIVNIVGLILIFFVIWWFWLSNKKNAVRATEAALVIKVANGVYTPDTIETKINKPIVLRFIREDETPCAATVIFSDFNKSADLPMSRSIDLSITPNKIGEFEFTCQMGMYRGKLIVTN